MNKQCRSGWMIGKWLWLLLLLVTGIRQVSFGQTKIGSDCKCTILTVTRKFYGRGTSTGPATTTVVTTPATTTLTAKLSTPTISPLSGAVGYGDTIRLASSVSLPDAITEYSYDEGKTWIAGNKISIISTVTMLVRTRQNSQTSEVIRASFRPFYRRLMVIGNSIMNLAPAPDLGWFNNNGMAASAPEKDFVHLVTAHLADLNPQVTVRLQPTGNFERYFGLPAYSIDEFNEPLQQFKPDLIIVRMGENVEDGDVNGSRNFESQFRQLIDKLATYGQPVRIVTSTSVWSRPQTDAIIRKVIREKGLSLVDLSSMVGVSQYFASQYANPAVAAHPNDAGMQRIADLLWDAIK